MTGGGTLPTPEVVAAARATRDGLVDEVRARLGSARKKDDAEIGVALHEATSRADRLADGRDADAQRIAQHGVLTRRQTEIEERIDAAKVFVTIKSADLETLSAGWAELLGKLGFLRTVPPGDFDRWRAERAQTLSIADDLDAATRALMEFEEELKAKRANQIILFSHHDHIVDVAEAAVGKDGFRLHRIDRNAAPLKVA